jgi:hypothetical protein
MTNGPRAPARAAVQGSVASCHGRSTPLDWVVASDVVSASAAVFIRWAATRSETVQTSGVASCNVPRGLAPGGVGAAGYPPQLCCRQRC